MVCLVIAVAGCSSTTIADVQPVIVAEWGDKDMSYPTALAFSADFQVMDGDQPSSATLSDTDSVTLTFMGATTELTNNGTLPDDFGYAPQVLGDPTGAEIEVDFHMGGDVAHASVTMPPGFAVTPITAPVSRQSAPVITWSPASPDDQMFWTANGDCLTGIVGVTSDEPIPLPDNGTWTMPTLIGDGSCTTTITFERTRSGTLDPAFHSGGRFEAIWSRELSFQSVP